MSTIKTHRSNDPDEVIADKHRRRKHGIRRTVAFNMVKLLAAGSARRSLDVMRQGRHARNALSYGYRLSDKLGELTRKTCQPRL